MGRQLFPSRNITSHWASPHNRYSWPEVRALLQHPGVTQQGNTTRCKYHSNSFNIVSGVDYLQANVF